MEREIYLAIDLKSFYASVECVERGLDPLTTNLVVADTSRTDKTICLAVSPSLKAHGAPSRPRLFEVISVVNAVNNARRLSAPYHKLVGATADDVILRSNPTLALEYIAATPRMSLYISYSTKIYGIYLKYFAPDDIHVYSIDEVFIDITGYTVAYKSTPRELAMTVISEILAETGITATVGIGTNLYLAKVAMDIVAKRISPDKNGVRIAELDEMSYRRMLWDHRPITDFWRVGHGYSKRLERHGMFTMGDVALRSLENENQLYELFGINAELLIDHAWGIESCRMENVKEYRPTSTSLSTGQVLSCPYDFKGARLICREMCDLLALDMVDKGIVTDQLVLSVGYDTDGVTESYEGEVSIDYYGRLVPRHAHGTVNFPLFTSSSYEITEATLGLFDKVVDRALLVRRINLCVTHLRPSHDRKRVGERGQMDFFADLGLGDGEDLREKEYEKEEHAQKAILSIKKKFGKNAILKGMNFEDGATTIERNLQIGGHKA